MRAAIFVVVVGMVVAGAGPAAADAKADVTAAFTAFVKGVAAGKPLLPGLELFVGPANNVELITSGTELKPLLVRHKVTVHKVVVSRSGKSAWLAAEIAAKVPRDGKIKDEPLRVSAFYVLDADGWRLRATFWSVAMKNAGSDDCGALSYEWHPDPSVPRELATPVKAVLEALADSAPAGFQALLSDDKQALAFGSAPKEKFVGGKAIKAVFKKWKVDLLYWDRAKPDLPARAAAAPDGELMWMAVGTAYTKLCAGYRTYFVLAKEPAGWRIVHQHYAEPIYLFTDE